MQIGSATPWMTTFHREPPFGIDGGGAQTPAAGASPGSEVQGPAPSEQTRDEVVAETAGSGYADPTRRPPEEQAQIEELKRRDQEVRQHEAAHMAAGGAYVRGGASYTYQPGPDGRRYAVGGEVSVDASPVANNPEATIAKMQTVRRAALAPANPSGQDLSVAARAAQAEMQARMQAAEASRAATEVEVAGDDNPETTAADRAPSSPADAVGPVPVSSGSLLDTYA